MIKRDTVRLSHTWNPDTLRAGHERAVDDLLNLPFVFSAEKLPPVKKNGVLYEGSIYEISYLSIFSTEKRIADVVRFYAEEKRHVLVSETKQGFVVETIWTGGFVLIRFLGSLTEYNQRRQEYYYNLWEDEESIWLRADMFESTGWLSAIAIRNRDKSIEQNAYYQPEFGESEVK